MWFTLQSIYTSYMQTYLYLHTIHWLCEPDLFVVRNRGVCVGFALPHFYVEDEADIISQDRHKEVQLEKLNAWMLEVNIHRTVDIRNQFLESSENEVFFQLWGDYKPEWFRTEAETVEWLAPWIHNPFSFWKHHFVAELAKNTLLCKI